MKRLLTTTVATCAVWLGGGAAPSGALQVPERPLDPSQGFVAVGFEEPGGAVRGQVRSEEGERALPFAILDFHFTGGPGQGSARPGGRAEPRQMAPRDRVLADAEGRYRVAGLAPGRWSIHVTALGHGRLQVDLYVAAGEEVELDLALPVQPIGLPPIRAAVAAAIAASAGGNDEGSVGITGRNADLRALEATPGMAELGIAEAASAGPEPIDPSSVLYVRGAAFDLKLVLLDGAPVYAPFHLGGLVESFHPDVLASSHLYVGGAPARYDGGLSYILDLQTRPGDADRFRASGAADILAVRQRVEGPVGPASYLLSGRAVHGAAHRGMTGEDLPYGYADLLGRVDVPLLSGRLSATGFWNRETVRLDTTAAVGPPARWGNTAGSVRFGGPAGPGRLDVTAALAEFQTFLPFAGEDPGVARGRSRQLRVAADYSELPAGPVDLGFGASFDRYLLELEREEIWGPLPSYLRAEALLLEGEGHTAAAYSEARWSPVEAVSLRGGLRLDAFFPAREARLAPRLSASWHVSDRATLTLAAGRFHQYVRAPETILGGDLDGIGRNRLEEFESDGTRASGFDLGIARASHLVLGLENTLSDGLRIGLEGFYKMFDRVPGTLATLRASGADLWVHRSQESWQAWLGYSLAFVWEDGSRPGRSSRFAGRHLLTGGMETTLRHGLRLEAHLAYGGGLPFTAIPVTSGGPNLADGGGFARESLNLQGSAEDDPPLAGAPPGSYLRLDAKISRGWLAQLGGVEVRIVPYLKVLNALDRRDALFYQFDPERDRHPRSLDALPLLPVVGVEWSL